MKRLRSEIVLSMAIVGLMLNGVRAKADMLSYAPGNQNQSAIAGQTIEFDATITNSESYTLNLNIGQMTAPPTPLTYDDWTAGFQLIFPWTLSPAGQTGDSFTGELFTITVPLGTANGTYGGEYIIQGGIDGNASDLLGTDDFTVTVNSPPPPVNAPPPPPTNSPVPEPSGFILLLSGIAGMVGTIRCRMV